MEKDKKDRKKETQMDATSTDPQRLNKRESVVQGSNEPKTFEIEISNPFFTGPNQIMLQDMSNAQKTNQQIAKPGAKDGKVVEQEPNANANLFVLNCNPTKPASFTCYVILKSLDRTDIRLYEYKLTAIP